MLVRGWTSWRTSGSSSRGLAVISSMRTEDSNAIRLESWVEGSICGSVLAQQRGRDSTGSQTRLYSKVWATRVFKGSRHRTLPVTTPQTHTHTPKKHKDSVFLSIFLFFWLVRCFKQDSDRRRCSWIYPWKSCSFYVKLQWERRVEGRGDEGGGEEKREEGEEIRWEERRGDKVADPLCSSQSFKSSLKRDWVVAKNLARHTHTCTHHISCINSHTQTWKDTNIIVRPLTLDTMNNEGSAAFIWQRISSLHHLIMAALNHTNTHLHTVLVVLDTVC